LTDAVTNLTGTLILLVVLMFGITHKVQPKIQQPPETSREEKGKPVGPLIRKVEMLKREIQAVDTQIQGLEQRIPALEQEIEQLRTDAGGETTEGTRPPAREGVFREPVDRVTFNWQPGRIAR
jgi:TolA-binding protein